MADEAKQYVTFIIEPLGSNVNAPTSYMLRKRFQGTDTTTSYSTSQVTTMFNDVMDQLSRPTASSSNMKGGVLFLKNGTYTLDGADGILVSNTTDDQDVTVRVVGETADNTIINAGSMVGGSEDAIFQPFCTFDIENVTLNGNSIADVWGIHPMTAGVATKVLRVKNCRFTNFEGFDIINGGNQHGIEISECRFDNHQSTEDNIAVGNDADPNAWVHVFNNVFDKKSAGTTNGSNLTSGGGNNFNIHDNIFLRAEGFPIHAISIEGFSTHYNNIFIHDNLIYNGRISIGSSGTWSADIRNVSVSNNYLFQGGIYIEGPDTGYTNSIKDVVVENNQLFDSWEAGIHLFHIGGFHTVRNNMIKNSNRELLVENGQEPLIFAEACTDSVVENNFLYMGVVSPANAIFSPQGIRFAFLTNPTIRDNRIINRTGSNPSYEDIGPHSGSILISKSL